MQKTATVRCHCRWMTGPDMPTVLQIEADNFYSPWTEEDFLRCLRQRNCVGYVAELDGHVVGYAVYLAEKRSLELLNLAVAPSHRRASIGAKMLLKLKSKLSAHRRSRIGAEVRETNLAVQVFLRSQGFEAVRVLRRSYEDTGEDGYRMVYRLPAE